MRSSAVHLYGPWPNRGVAQQFLNGLANPPQARATQPEAGLDAAAIITWLSHQGLAPLAYATYRRDPVWQPLTHSLSPLYYENQSASLIRLDLLRRVLERLAAQHIPVVLLKGGALGLTVYHDPALRPMGDVDLWIQRGHLPEAWQAVEQTGYRTQALWGDAAALPERLTQMDFYTQTPRMCLELHWDLVSRPQLMGRLPLVDWWQRVRTIPWQGLDLFILDPAAMLLHVCLHQMYQHHGDSRLIWLYDLDRLIRGTPEYHLTDADWELVRQEANQVGILPGVQAALRAAAAWFNTPLPASVRTLLQEIPSQAQTEQYQALVAPGAGLVSKSWREIWEQPAWLDRLAILAYKLFPPPSYIRQRYQLQHTWQIPLYYPWRWLKLARIILTGRREG